MAGHDHSDLADAMLALATVTRSQGKNAGNSQSKSCGGFLDYPFDMRAMIYEVFFAAESCESGEAKPEVGESFPVIGLPTLLAETDDRNEGSEEGITQLDRRMTAHDKVSLLLANKAVLEEASPFFHRLHVFRLSLLRNETCLKDLSRLSDRIQHSLRAMAKVQVGGFEGDSFYRNDRCLWLLKDACPNLKWLTTDIYVPHGYDPKEYLEEHPLDQLWPRLDHLQLYVRYHSCNDVVDLLHLIAPGFKWSWYEKSNEKGRVYRGVIAPKFRKKVFMIDRDHLEEGVTEIDETPLGSDDDSATSSDDDEYLYSRGGDYNDYEEEM